MVSRRHLLKLSALGTASFAAPLAYSASNTTMTHNTGNPIGSTSPKDLSDNTRSLDYLCLGPDHAYLDRKGVPRKSWKGMEEGFSADQEARESQFSAFLDSSGYEAPVEYSPGIVLCRATQTVTYLGKEYRAKSQFLPLTTMDWVSDEPKLKLVGDDSLRQEVSNITDPELGAGMVGMDGRRLRDYLKQQEYFLTIEYFGETDTPANTKATMQRAINFCAANKILLRNKVSSYTIDVSESSITIPDDFECDINAWINRAAGNKTPHDMWVNADTVNGNTGLNIRSVKFNGRAKEDNLTNETIAHRFCGLRLVKCEGRLTSVRVDDTCNGEIQDEGTRGGILLQNSVFMDCQGLRADNNIGTGLFITGGRGRLSNFQANNNSGSGLSGDQPGWMFESLRSVGSGYSGISLNGPGWTARGIYASGAAFGFAGVNFGHTTPVSANGVGAIASDVVAENNASWGINATSCPGLQGSNWVARKSGDNNIRLIKSPGVKISLVSENAGANGLLIDGEGYYDIDAQISGSKASGVYGRSFADIVISAGSLITGNGSVGGFAAEVTLDTASRASVHGKVLNGKAYGVQSSDSSVLTVAGGTVKGNALGNVRAATGGVVRYENAKFSDDPMSGTLTVLAGNNFVQVFNGNMMDPNRLVINPANAAGRTAGTPMIVTYTPGVSFTVQLAANAPTDCGYRWIIN